MSQPTLPATMAFNGLNQSSGDYLLPAMTDLELGQLARLVRFDQQMALQVGVSPHDLEQAGWGVVFATPVDDSIKEALQPLLNHRKVEAGERYFELTYEKPWNYRQFLEHHKGAPGPVDKLPYYLLLVGSPEEIPFAFQYQLGVQYAVGRLDFDSVDEYAHYAASVVKTETERRWRPRRATLFAVENADDRATLQSTRYLVKPLAETLRAQCPDWAIDEIRQHDATKDRLGEVLRSGDDLPALLFTASHGLGFANGHRLQRRHQGALVCSDWPGPEQWRDRAVPEDFYFSADDIDERANLNGLMAFHFACYGGGTPELDAFSFRKPDRPIERLAPTPFVAQLPKRLLTNRAGGALAVIGHVERAWGWSFLWEGGAGAQPQTFEDTTKRLLLGWRVGAAIGTMTMRYAELSTEFAELLEKDLLEASRRRHQAIAPGSPHRPPPRPRRESEDSIRRRGRLWTARNDARSYIVLGDPAVRLREPDND